MLLPSDSRLAIAKLFIELARVFYTGDTGASFSSDLQLIFLGSCVAVGDLEKRPMSVSDVAGYIGVPRATAQRKLAELVRRGWAERAGTRYVLTAQMHAHPAWKNAVKLVQRVEI